MKSIHIAGTNGKGPWHDVWPLRRSMDCSRLFTSRIWTVLKAIQLDGYLFEEEPFWQAATVVREVERRLFESGAASYFEILTAMMFVVFSTGKLSTLRLLKSELEVC